MTIRGPRNVSTIFTRGPSTPAVTIIVAALLVLVAATVAIYRRRLIDPPPPDVPVAHRRLLAALRNARHRGALDEAAEVRGALARQAFAAADLTTRAWMAARDPVLGILPREYDLPRPIWDYKDVAADCYAHLVIAAHLVAPDLLPGMRDILATDRRLFPEAIDLTTGAALPMSHDDRIFGAAEYAKDGLLSILELLGKTPWEERLTEVVDRIWADGGQATGAGNRVVLDRAETNGNMLQVLARLWRRTRDPRHLARGRGIADAYVNEALPANGGLPPHRFDFGRGVAIEGRVKLRDHGNEMIAGLVEWTLVEREAPNGRADVYAPTVERMLDRVLDVGRDSEGLWLHEAGGGARPDGLLNDNWGYVSSAFVAYARALPQENPRRQRYLDAALQSLRAAAGHRGGNWEHGRMDGFADTIEGALYLLAFLDDPAAADWVDEEAGRLLAYGRSDGFATRMYLDGNFVRTMLLYAQWKTAGIVLAPWRPDVRVGAERDGVGWRIAVQADAPWRGVLRFDGPRHRETLHLGDNYPRLNAWPEWFPVEMDVDYAFDDVDAGTRTMRRGEQMRQGVALELAAGATVHWWVTPVSPSIGRSRCGAGVNRGRYGTSRE